MAKVTFKTTATGKEYPARFAGMEFHYETPEAVPGDIDATLDALRAVCDSDADFATLLVAKFNGQGFNLDYQKEIKAFLGKEEKVGEDSLSVHRDRTPEEVKALADEHMATFRISLGRTPGEGKGSKVKQAEAKAAAAEEKANAAVNAVRNSYMKASASVRKLLRADLISDGVFTEADLDAMDAEISAGK